MNELFAFLFFSREHRSPEKADIQRQFDHLRWYLASLLSDVHHNAKESQNISDEFFALLPQLYQQLLKDAQAIADFDPAANSLQEVFVAYPGFLRLQYIAGPRYMHEQQAKTLPHVYLLSMHTAEQALIFIQVQ